MVLATWYWYFLGYPFQYWRWFWILFSSGVQIIVGPMHVDVANANKTFPTINQPPANSTIKRLWISKLGHMRPIRIFHMDLLARIHEISRPFLKFKLNCSFLRYCPRFDFFCTILILLGNSFQFSSPSRDNYNYDDCCCIYSWFLLGRTVLSSCCIFALAALVKPSPSTALQDASFVLGLQIPMSKVLYFWYYKFENDMFESDKLNFTVK